MMNWDDQAITLSAIMESALLVDQLARTGQAPTIEMEAIAGSLFQFEWDSVEHIFGGLDPLERGLARLQDLMRQGTAGAAPNVMRYAMAMLYLGNKLRRDRDRLDIIRSRLEHTALKHAHFSSHFDQLAASVSSIYQDTISTYRYRIQISGSAEHLQDTRVADRIRTLLLAGIRAAILWRFLDGSRLKLLFNRRQLALACARQLARVNPHQ